MPSAPNLKLQNYSITQLQITCDSESVVGVLELRWDTRSGAAAGYFDVVTPRASARRFASRLNRRLIRAWRISLGRDRIVVWVVPVAAPFVDVIADLIQTECIGGILCDRFGPGPPAGSVVWERLRRLVSPW